MQQLPRLCSILALLAAATTGCTVTPGVWPFKDDERTNFPTPAMRTGAIQEFAARSDGRDTPEQQALTAQLARQIQIEPDPLVRATIIETISKYNTPLASQVMIAGLGDSDPIVRRKCCVGLGAKGDAFTIEPLARALREDGEADVRVAAANALGRIESPEAIRALAAALQDRDPALQYAGMQSVKQLSGKDFGGDVRAYLQFAQGENPTVEKSEVSIAERIRQMNPF